MHMEKRISIAPQRLLRRSSQLQDPSLRCFSVWGSSGRVFSHFATLIGLVLNFTKFDPIKALVWAATINGITAAPVMCFMILLASRRKVMGKLTLPLSLKIFGWIATAIMALAAIGMVLTSGK
jgi:Mn2+/Fe2+ NRAMP family transporter